MWGREASKPVRKRSQVAFVRLFITAGLACALMGAANPGNAVYGPPAGNRPAGAPDQSNPYNTILPNGRIISPSGKSVVAGMNPLGVALSPDGRFAVVSNDDERQEGAHSAVSPKALGGYSIAVVDTRTMRLTDVFKAENTPFFLGIAALKDPKDPRQTLVIASGGPSNTMHFFHLSSAGTLREGPAYLAIAAPTDAHFANQNHAFPGSLAVSRDGRIAYVVNNLANSVTAIDIAGRRAMHSARVGYFPYSAAVAGGRLFVTDPGLMRYAALEKPVRVPEFANVAPSIDASALSVVPLERSGDVAATGGYSLPLDRVPDGMRTVGGAHPSAIVTSKDGRYAFVCMTNVDRISVVALSRVPHVVGGIDLQLFARSPYGTQPNSLALSPDGKRLYVAMAGLNAVAVLDARNPAKLHRLGLIPTGWYPAALALSPSGRYLYVANAKGIGEEPRFQGGPPYRRSSNGRIVQSSGDSNTIWGTLQRVDLLHLPLPKTTLATLRYNRVQQSVRENAVLPPLRSMRASSAIKHVVFILEENKTYDSMLGDLSDAAGRPHGNGDPNLVSFPQSVTPNLHALARDFGVADNYYSDGDESDAGHQYAAGGVATAYSEKTLLVKGGRAPLVNKNEDPEDYPRAGYIFNAAQAAGLSYRDYGDLVRLSGYDEGSAENIRDDDPSFRDVQDRTAQTTGLGGMYFLNVPAPASLRDHVDLNYPGWNLHIRDERRADEFIRDYDGLERSGQVPAFTYIWLPADHGGFGPSIPALPEEVADGDRALGKIVDYLSHRQTWGSTAIFIVPDDAQSTRDHVSEHRSYAVVVSPFAKRGYVGSRHISTVSVLKTEEEILGLPGLALNDLLAGDLADFFTSEADARPYSAISVPEQTASAEGRRIAALLLRTDQSAPDADVERSARIIGFSRRADRLAERRNSMTPGGYATAQRALYDAALHILH